MGIGTTLTDSSKEMPRRLGLVEVVVVVLDVLTGSSFEYLRGSCILASDKCLGDVKDGDVTTTLPGTGKEAGMAGWAKSRGFLRPVELAREGGEGRALLVSFMAEERWVMVSSVAQTTPRL